MGKFLSTLSRPLALFLVFLFGATTLAAIPAANAAISINLGSAANYTLLAGSTITNGAGTRLTGASNIRVGVSPGRLILSEVNSLKVSGATAFDNGSAAAAQAQADFEAGRSQLNSLPSSEEVADLSDQTFTPGVYTSNAAWTSAADITLDGLGNSGSVFVFRTAAAITTAASSRLILTNGASAENVYWVAGAAFNAGASSYFSGHILATAAATIGAGAYIDGQIIASRSVPITLGAGAVVNYSGSSPIFSYVVAFDSGQAIGSQPTISGVAKTLTIPRPTITKIGFVFAGWNTLPDGSGTRYIPEQVVGVTAPTALYLHPTWQLAGGSSPSGSPTNSSSPSGLPSGVPVEGAVARWVDETLGGGVAGVPFVDAVRVGVFKDLISIPISTCSYELSSGVLPFGLSLDRATGIVLGTTQAWGVFRFDISATCPGYIKLTKSYSITVAPGSIATYPLTLGTPMPTTPAMAAPGVASSCTVVPALPAGLNLDLATCSVFGVPAAVQTLTTYVVTASTASYYSTRQFQLGIASTLVKAVYFAPGSSKLSATAITALNKIVAAARVSKAKTIRITGFADSMPARGDVALARSRTNSVKSYLAARLPGVIFALSSNGSANATAAPMTTSAQAINRRVEIRVG